MKKQLKAFVKKPGESLTMTTIDNTLEALQQLVGGNIEALFIDAGVVMICNEEGRINGMPFNCTVCGCAMFGPVVFVGDNGGEDFVDCPVKNLAEFNRIGFIRDIY